MFLPGSNSGTFIFELFYDWSCKITVPIGLSNGSRKDDYLNIYTELGYDKESVENFQLASGSDIFNALFFGMFLFENIANQYKLKRKKIMLFVLKLKMQEILLLLLTEINTKNILKNMGSLMHTRK